MCKCACTALFDEEKVGFIRTNNATLDGSQNFVSGADEDIAVDFRFQLTVYVSDHFPAGVAVVLLNRPLMCCEITVTPLCLQIKILHY